MQTTYYMSVQASKQGEITGEGGKKSSARGIPILGYTLGVTVPRDASSGQATGRRAYEPIGVYKIAGPVTPQLFQALVNNEALPKVVLSVYRTGKNDKETLYFTITLTNAHISGLEHEPGDGEDASELEKVAFVFQKIELSNLSSGASAVDDWNQAA
jgi:type VI secretion system secreted protein Hcp